MTWLDVHEVMELLGIYKKQNFNRDTEHFNLEIIKEKKPGGGFIRKVKFSSLPTDAQIKYLQAHKDDDGDCDRLSMDWKKLSDSQRKTALTRLKAVEKARHDIEMAPHGNKLDILGKIAKKNGVSTRNLKRWIDFFEKGRLDEQTGEELTGIMALVPQYGKTAGKFIVLSSDMQEYLKAVWWRKTRPSKQVCFERLQYFCNSEKLEVPSQSTVFRYLLSLPASSNELYRVGDRSYKSKFEPVVKRTVLDLQPNDIWVGDHREHDVFIYLNNGKKKVKRIWMTAWWDLASGKLVGVHFSFNPNSNTIAIALRNGILTHGLPKQIYIDNGKDYQSHYFSGGKSKKRNIRLNSETMGIIQHLGIEQINAIPYTPRSKPIERWFKLWSERFDRELPGWCGRDNKERPEKLLSEMKTGKLLTLTQFIEMAETFRKQLDQKPYGERTQSPAEYYKNFNKHTVEPHVLDLLLMKEKENIKVTTQGIKIFGGLFYQSSTLMANVPVGEKVSVRYDDNDLSYVIVWYGKKCLGRVPVDERVSMAGGRFDVEAVKKVQRYRRDQRKLLADMSPDVKPLVTDEFHQTLERIQKERTQVDRDDRVPEPEGNVIRIFPAVQKDADDARDAEKHEPGKAKIVSLFGKAVNDDLGDDNDDDVDRYERLF